MPKFKDDETLENHNIAGSHYGYTAARPDQLGATEYTLVSILFDESGSTAGFARKMEEALKAIIRACRNSPRADNLMLRLLNFGTKPREVHGYKTLGSCNEADYDGVYQSGGGTALFDAAHNGIEATNSYAQQLHSNDFSVNAIVIVITDGEDNESRFGIPEVGKALGDCIKLESLESLISILIGVNAPVGSMTDLALQRLNTGAGFTQYVQVDNLDDKALAKICEFVSKSISSQSQALGTGGPSKSLTF